MRALSAIAGRLGGVSGVYPQNVADGTTYVLEQFIDGVEYALDLFFENQGQSPL